MAHKIRGTKAVPDNSRQGKPVSQHVGKVAHGPHNHRLQDCTVKDEEEEEEKWMVQATHTYVLHVRMYMQHMLVYTVHTSARLHTLYMHRCIVEVGKG